jgi:hypothetical protein
MRSPCCLPIWLCVLYIPINFWTAEPIFMKLGMYVMAPEPMLTQYVVSPISLRVCMCILLTLLGNGSVETLPRQRIHAQQ